MKTFKRLSDAYRFPGFTSRINLKGLFGDSRARIVSLHRRGKKRFAATVARFAGVSMTGKPVWYGTSPVGTFGSTWRWKSGGWIARVAVA